MEVGKTVIVKTRLVFSEYFRLFIPSVLFTSLIFVIILFAGIHTPGSPSASDLYIMIVSPVGFFFLLFFLSRFRVRNEFEGDLFLKNEVTWKFSESGFEAVSPFAQLIYSWKIVRKVREHKSSFFIYFSDRKMHVLPKRCFESGDIEALRDLLKKCAGPNVKLMNR